MKNLIIGMALCAASVSAMAQTNVSVSIGQPGFYGRIDLGDYAPAPVVYAPQPVIIDRGPAYIAEPVYLRVPPGHRHHWSRFCGRYNACGRRVLFVRDDWYANSYAPRYREHFGGPRVVYRDRGPGPGWDHGRHERHERWEHERWEHGRGEGHGRGHDEGRGHGEGHGHGHGHGRD